MATVGIVSPGSMGAAIGGILTGAGVEVQWAGAGRSAATRRRAEEAGLSDAGTVEALCEAVEVLMSICPPHAARDVAKEVAGHGFGGVYVDANAVAPSTVTAIQQDLGPGVEVVDGSLVGGAPTPGEPTGTRLYLAGTRADDVAGLFRGGALTVVVMDAGPPAASELKLAHAAWSKGELLLLLSVLTYAESVGVSRELLDQWGERRPELVPKAERASDRAGPKAWRWRGEMEEIAEAFSRLDLPEGFFTAAAELCGRLEVHKDGSPDLAEVVDSLRARRQ